MIGQHDAHGMPTRPLAPRTAIAGEVVPGESVIETPDRDDAAEDPALASAAEEPEPEAGEGEAPSPPSAVRRPRGNPLLFGFSWAESTDEQRGKFLKAVTLGELVKAMPEEMRNEMFALIEVEHPAVRPMPEAMRK
jgi:hypothetical protein